MDLILKSLLAAALASILFGLWMHSGYAATFMFFAAWFVHIEFINLKK